VRMIVVLIVLGFSLLLVLLVGLRFVHVLLVLLGPPCYVVAD
jgi:hypothetical protein